MNRNTLLLLGVIALTVIWCVLGNQESPRDRVDIQGQAQPGSTSGSRATVALNGPSAGIVQSIEESPGEQEARIGVLHKTLGGLRGRLLIPNGAPFEPDLELHVRTRSKKTPWRLVPVAEDGDFRLREGDAQPAAFYLRSSFLLLSEEQVVHSAELVTVRPTLGAQVRGNIHAPWAEEGEPLFDVYLARLPASLEEWEIWPQERRKRRPEYLQSLSVAAGEFMLHVLPANVPLLVQLRSRFGIPMNERLVLSPGESRELHFEVLRGVSIAGRVVSSEPDFDAYEYKIRVSRGGYSARRPGNGGISIEDPDGNFQLTGLGAGRLVLTAVGPRTASIEIDAPLGSAHEGVIIDLGRAATISGYLVRDASHWPRELEAKAYVSLKHPAGWVSSVVPDNQLRFQFKDLVQGRPYELCVRMEGNGVPFDMRSKWTEVFAPNEDVVLGLPEVATVIGHVRGLGESHLEWFGLQLSGQGHWQESDGSFEIRVPPGEHSVRATSDDYAPSAPMVLNLAAGQVLKGVELVLGDALTSLAGVVVDETGLGLGGAEVWASERPPSLGQPMTFGFEARTGADGRFLLPHLRPGKMWLQAHHRDSEYFHGRVEVRRDGTLARSGEARTSLPLGVELKAGERLQVSLQARPGS